MPDPATNGGGPAVDLAGDVRTAHDVFEQLDRIERLVTATAMRLDQLDALLARYQPLLERAERRASRTSFFAPKGDDHGR